MIRMGQRGPRGGDRQDERGRQGLDHVGPSGESRRLWRVLSKGVT